MGGGGEGVCNFTGSQMGICLLAPAGQSLATPSFPPGAGSGRWLFGEPGICSCLHGSMVGTRCPPPGMWQLPPSLILTLGWGKNPKISAAWSKGWRAGPHQDMPQAQLVPASAAGLLPCCTHSGSLWQSFCMKHLAKFGRDALKILG